MKTVEDTLNVFSRTTGTQVVIEKQSDGKIKLTFSDLVLLLDTDPIGNFLVEPLVGEIMQ